MAAGRGERLRPLTNSLPKALVPIAGKPLLQWTIEHMQSAGVNKITVATGWKGALIQSFLDMQSFENVSMIRVSDYNKGPLHTLVRVLELEEPEDFIVTPVDAWLTMSDLKGLVSAPSSNLLLATDYTRHTGTPVYSGNGFTLLGLGGTSISNATQGSSAMVFRASENFAKAAILSKAKGQHRVLPVINQMISDGMDMLSYPIAGVWFDLDEISHLLEANGWILEEFTESLNGVLIPPGDIVECGDRIHLAETTVADRGVLLRGPVLLLSGCHVGEGSQIGPHVTMGTDTIIGPSCKIQNSIFFGASSTAANTSITDSIVFKSTVFGGR